MVGRRQHDEGVWIGGDLDEAAQHPGRRPPVRGLVREASNRRPGVDRFGVLSLGPVDDGDDSRLRAEVGDPIDRVLEQRAFTTWGPELLWQAAGDTGQPAAASGREDERPRRVRHGDPFAKRLPTVLRTKSEGGREET